MAHKIEISDPRSYNALSAEDRMFVDRRIARIKADPENAGTWLPSRKAYVASAGVASITYEIAGDLVIITEISKK